MVRWSVNFDAACIESAEGSGWVSGGKPLKSVPCNTAIRPLSRVLAAPSHAVANIVRKVVVTPAATKVRCTARSASAPGALAQVSSDLTFLTNESGNSLRTALGVLLGKDTRYFDCYPALERVERVHILVGLKTDRTAYELLHQAKHGQLALKAHALDKRACGQGRTRRTRSVHTPAFQAADLIAGIVEDAVLDCVIKGRPRGGIRLDTKWARHFELPVGILDKAHMPRSGKKTPTSKRFIAGKLATQHREVSKRERKRRQRVLIQKRHFKNAIK